MAITKAKTVALTTVLILGGCSFVEDALFPSVTGSDPGAERIQVHPSVEATPASASTAVVSEAIYASPSTGTAVGQKVSALRGEMAQLQAAVSRQEQTLAALRAEIVADSQQYHGTVAAIRSRLQLGTTPANPALQQQWRTAQAELEKIGADLGALSRMYADINTTSSTAAYLLNAVEATRSLPGAVEEDHRQLRMMEDEVQRLTVNLERMLSEVTQDLSRQQQYVANERGDLTTLSAGIQAGQLYGQSLGVQSAPVASVPLAAALPTAADRPLVTIKFNRPNVAYESDLYEAVKDALERRPSAMFDVIAVSPQKGSAGQAALNSAQVRRNAERVVRSLTSMGLPAGRVRVSAMQGDVAAGEVRVFVR